MNMTNSKGINAYFPYKWKAFDSDQDVRPQVDPLLASLIRKDFSSAKNLLVQGMRFEDIERQTFKRALYEFLVDYERMLFLVRNGFDIFHFKNIDCTDERGRRWGIVGRAYCYKDKKIVELLFSVGFGLSGNGMYWGKDTDYQLGRYLQYHFDKEFIDLMLGYGRKAWDAFLDMSYDDTLETYATERYLKSNPEVTWKGYALSDQWYEEIPEPPKPRLGILISRKKKDYDRKMQAYREQKRVQKEFLDSITLEDQIIMQEAKRYAAKGLYALNTVDQLIEEGKQNVYRKGEYGKENP